MPADQFDSTPEHTTISPPIDPGELGPSAPAPAWHKPIGVIAIVFGSLGMLGGCWGMVAPQVMGTMASKMPPEVAGQVEVMHDFAGWTIASSLVGLVVAAALLVAGIGVHRQRRWGVTVARVWAVGKMLLVVATGVLTYQVFQETAARMSQTQGMQAMPGGFMSAMGGATTAVGVLWGWALPVFLLVWFGRRKIKQEVGAWA